MGTVVTSAAELGMRVTVLGGGERRLPRAFDFPVHYVICVTYLTGRGVRV